MIGQKRWMELMMVALATLMSSALFAAEPVVGTNEAVIDIYDEATYTEFVDNTMKELDQLYLDYCAARGVDATKSRLARQEFLVKVRDLMGQMNARYDELDPKKGAALSPTETLVSVHVLTMLVDIMASTDLEQMAANPYIN